MSQFELESNLLNFNILFQPNQDSIVGHLFNENLIGSWLFPGAKLHVGGPRIKASALGP